MDTDDFPEPDEKKSVFMLFLPENRWHELGLLFAHRLLKQYGHRVIYLGAAMPLGELKKYARRVHFDSMLTAVNSAIYHSDLQSYMQTLSESFPEKHIFAAGNQFEPKPLKFPENITYLKSFTDLIDAARQGRL